MRIERLGEKAGIIREVPCSAFQLARRLNETSVEGPRGFLEAVASYETVGVYFADPILEPEALENWILGQLPNLEALENSFATHELPVCYELGEDLASAANALDLPPNELIALHLSAEYRCYAVGFAPGFAYLGYLNERIGTLPRLASPRTRVPLGSVGIAGRQTAVYPSATPGGWNLIGRCPLTLVDVDAGYFPIEAGDRVRFRRIDESEFRRLEGDTQ